MVKIIRRLERDNSRFSRLIKPYENQQKLLLNVVAEESIVMS